MSGTKRQRSLLLQLSRNKNKNENVNTVNVEHSKTPKRALGTGKFYNKHVIKRHLK